jgi:hypothetical protein
MKKWLEGDAAKAENLTAHPKDSSHARWAKQ